MSSQASLIHRPTADLPTELRILLYGAQVDDIAPAIQPNY
jgi:hypothetical protein